MRIPSEVTLPRRKGGGVVTDPISLHPSKLNSRDLNQCQRYDGGLVKKHKKTKPIKEFPRTILIQLIKRST